MPRVARLYLALLTLAATGLFAWWLARWAEWPLGRVYLAAGILEPTDLEVHLDAGGVVMAALDAVEHSALAAGLSTPLRQATLDHQRLIAELYLLAEQATLRGTKV